MGVKKILFLDFDGVICIPENNYEIESSKKQKLLQKILDETDCYLVISSSRRCHNVEETKRQLSEKGFLYCDRIIGVTIRAYQYLDKNKKIHLSIPRGVEIKQWIDTNVHSNNGKDFNRQILCVDYNYCIIDDDVDMLLEHKDYFVRIDGEIGLTERNVRKAIDILNCNTI